MALERGASPSAPAVRVASDRGEDAAARGVQLLVRRPAGPKLELVGAVAPEERMRVAVDEARDGRAPAPSSSIDVAVERRLEVAHRAYRRDAAVLAQDVAVQDDLDGPKRAPSRSGAAPGRARRPVRGHG